MQRTAEGFTILVCSQGSCERNTSAVLGALGALVRASRHGVLARAGAAVGSACHGTSRLGTYAVVQPCDAQRRPTSPAVYVGPLCSREDVADLAGWIHNGFDLGHLPLRLRAADRARVAAQN
ncbi:MAG: hypothetical protein ACT4QF_14355 [Sporichthyaceae bacterium]